MANSIENTINNIKEPTKVILTTMTEVKLNKKDKSKELINELGKVFKMQKIVVELNVNYEDRMNQLLLESGKEADFKSSGLPWGTNIDEHWVEHKGNKYLKVIENEKVGEPQYVVNDEDGMFIDIEKSEFEPFLPAYTPSKSNEPTINFRMYNLDSIIDIEPYEISN